MRHALLAATLTLAARTPRGAMVVVPPDTVTGTVSTVYVGTTRSLEPTGIFGSGRSETLNFARYDVAIPPDREIGKISDGKPKRPNVSTDFVTTNPVLYSSGNTFRADLCKSLSENGREAVIFVHGFNNTFTEGLYRIAQLHHDLDVPGVAVHYSWRSAAEPLGYVYDRDSVIFARDSDPRNDCSRGQPRCPCRPLHG